MFDFVSILDYLGTLAFAISGIRLASIKRFDWFGAYVVGLVTAIGGGTLRDIFLNIHPFWMTQPSYIIVTAIALAIYILFSKRINQLSGALFLFDAIGLGFFVVVGIEKTLQAGFPFWAAIILGSFTGAAGGVLRDVLINEEPLIFRKEIYAMACVIGGFLYFLPVILGLSAIYSEIICALGVIIIRILAVKFEISLPVLHSEQDN